MAVVSKFLERNNLSLLKYRQGIFGQVAHFRAEYLMERWVHNDPHNSLFRRLALSPAVTSVRIKSIRETFKFDSYSRMWVDDIAGELMTLPDHLHSHYVALEVLLSLSGLTAFICILTAFSGNYIDDENVFHAVVMFCVFLVEGFSVLLALCNFWNRGFRRPKDVHFIVSFFPFHRLHQTRLIGTWRRHKR
ncbi:hypothetical protein RvY_07236 [Ramazzottius varieornatus]|uniref:Uncharacterized protein n=1 Tax=Ramazzottius varieornatus TaxID=947166 RepID=A0A1D1V1M4_RAMVA|nr:hypothetical protein RvY_07236 [Ramazzottius varieornatus]